MSVGDKPGHPFRGNQYTSHSGQVVVEGTPEDRGVKAAREVVRRVNEKVGYRPEEDLRVQLENARYRREAAATSSQSRVRNTERVRQIRAYDAELSALGGSKVAPDLEHLARENKIPATPAEVVAQVDSAIARGHGPIRFKS